MNIRAGKKKKEKTDSRSGRLGRLSAAVRSEALIIVALVVGVYFVSRSVISSRDLVQVRFVDNTGLSYKKLKTFNAIIKLSKLSLKSSN